jgi:hypothetical protein
LTKYKNKVEFRQLFEKTKIKKEVKMKKIFGVLLVLLLVTAAAGYGQEIELKELGRAPLSPYLQSVQEVKNLLGRVNEEVGRALGWFPGGGLGEQVYAALYEQLPQLRLEITEIHPGQKMIWMMYSKGRLLKSLIWKGNEPFQAYKFRLEVEGKIFTFIVPVRCGNIALLEMREAPVAPQPPAPQSPAPVQQPKPAPQPSVPVPQPTPVPPPPVSTPPVVTHSWSPTIKIKLGGGWAGINFPAPVDFSSSKFNFFSLIPSDSSVFYCEDGVAFWYYSPRQSIPFTVGQSVPLWRHEVFEVKKGKNFPFYAAVELEFAPNLLLTGSFFQVGKYSSFQYEGKESMAVDEVRLLGQYTSSGTTNCPPTYVYYVGVHRDWNELLIRENIRIQEFSAGISYQLRLAKKFFVTPQGGVTWQVRRGTKVTDTTTSKWYPFKEAPLEKERVTEVVEKVKTTTTHPYVGIGLELGPLFLEGRRLFGDQPGPVKISPWRVQGGILLKI